MPELRSEGGQTLLIDNNGLIIPRVPRRRDFWYLSTSCICNEGDIIILVFPTPPIVISDTQFSP